MNKQVISFKEVVPPFVTQVYKAGECHMPKKMYPQVGSCLP